MIRTFVVFIQRLGAGFYSVWDTLFDIFGLLYDTLVAAWHQGRRGYGPLFKQITSQILFTGVEAFWLVTVVGLISGVTIVIQGMTNMPKFGVGDYFGSLLVIAVVRELGPFFTAFVVIGRSGAALSVYIGNMRVTREISALEIMGIDPVHFLVLPAFWGMLISMVCLTLYFSVIAIVGGILVAYLMGVTSIPFGVFMAKVMDALTWQQVFVALFKSLLFGAMVAIVSCYYGLRVQTVREVPQASIKSVVLCMASTIMVNILFTMVSYVGRI